MIFRIVEIANKRRGAIDSKLKATSFHKFMKVKLDNACLIDSFPIQACRCISQTFRTPSETTAMNPMTAYATVASTPS